MSDAPAAEVAAISSRSYGQNPTIQEKVRAEARGVLSGRLPEVGDIPKLVYCDRVIREAMRLYPPAYVVGRRALEDITIGSHFIPAGTNVLMSQWLVHRDARWFDDPLRFNPDRWQGDFAQRLPKYAYFPFGGGPRLCIGATFALFEAPLILAMMAERVELELATDAPVAPLPVVTLRPGGPINFRVKSRF